MYNCTKHDSTFVGEECPSCEKEIARKIDFAMAIGLCFICLFFIAYAFSYRVTLYALVFGASSWLAAEIKYRND